MIGDTGDFEMEDYVQDGPQPKDEISEFGNMYGAEDGWSDEMQGIGSFEGQLGYSRRHSFYRKPIRRGKPMHGVDFSMGAFEHPMAGSSAQMGGYLDDLKAKLQAGLTQVKTQITTQADKALAAEKAKIQAQLDAKKAELVAQAKQTITTQATNLINKAADTATTKLNQAIVNTAQSPIVQGAVTAGTTSAIDKALAFKDEMLKKSKPAVIAVGTGLALFIAWKIYQAKKAR